MNAPLFGSPRCIVLPPSGFSSFGDCLDRFPTDVKNTFGCRTEQFTKECAWEGLHSRLNNAGTLLWPSLQQPMMLDQRGSHSAGSRAHHRQEEPPPKAVKWRKGRQKSYGEVANNIVGPRSVLQGIGSVKEPVRSVAEASNRGLYE